MKQSGGGTDSSATSAEGMENEEPLTRHCVPPSPHTKRMGRGKKRNPLTMAAAAKRRDTRPLTREAHPRPIRLNAWGEGEVGAHGRPSVGFGRRGIEDTGGTPVPPKRFCEGRRWGLAGIGVSRSCRRVRRAVCVSDCAHRPNGETEAA